MIMESSIKNGVTGGVPSYYDSFFCHFQKTFIRNQIFTFSSAKLQLLFHYATHLRWVL